ncbi:unnamed protein product [Spirodela intermedia]|uniref:Large ribosomal subunit protein bL32m n=1 Tax=Spirodela intermedia TaxID=51605 RepID=A0A7I8LET8_SPIIN|nr:unnamed protein product [Spirodela intermedia]
MAAPARASLRRNGERADTWGRHLLGWFGGRRCSFSHSTAPPPPAPLLSSLPISSPASAEQRPQLVVPGVSHFWVGSMELMAVPKKKVSPYKKGLRNGPKALKPAPVIVRCKSCGRVKLPHFYCCSGDKGIGGARSESTQ